MSETPTCNLCGRVEGDHCGRDAPVCCECGKAHHCFHAKAVSVCSCWLGRPGATFGDSAEREVCVIHGEVVAPEASGPAALVEELRAQAAREKFYGSAAAIQSAVLMTKAADALDPDAPAPAHKACPCLHTTPCNPRCTCVTPHSSRGCSRCCTYGSKEQQVTRAETLVALMEAGAASASPAPAPKSWWTEDTRAGYRAYKASGGPLLFNGWARERGFLW